jgi:hypothetical protein
MISLIGAQCPLGFLVGDPFVGFTWFVLIEWLLITSEVFGFAFIEQSIRGRPACHRDCLVVKQTSSRRHFDAPADRRIRVSQNQL